MKNYLATEGLCFSNSLHNRQCWQAPDLPAELAKRVICAWISEICFFRDFMGLKRQKIFWSLLVRYLYTRQLAYKPQTGAPSLFLSCWQERNEKKRPVLSIEVLHPATCRLLLLLYLYARTNNAKSLWQLKQGSIWKHEIKLMTCHYKQAATVKIS